MPFRPRRQRSDAPRGSGAKPLPAALIVGGLGILVLTLLPERAGDGAREQRAGAAPTPLEVAAPRTELEADRPTAGGERRSAADPLWERRGFRLAAVRRGARVGVYERRGRGLLERVGDETEFGSPQVFGVLGRRGRWLRVTTPISPDNDPLWIRAERRRLRFETTRVSVHADLGERTTELRVGGEVRRRFPVTIGAAGSATPTGRFAVTDLITRGLNPVYGCCAIAISARQTDLPPDWIGGDRVAIHGTEGPVGSAASNGCIRAANADAAALIRELPLGAPVFVTG